MKSEISSPSPSVVLSPSAVVLRQELDRRCRKNPGYSLRAFARSLGLSHTFVSYVLAGKRPLSRKAALRITQRLELGADQISALLGSSSESQSRGVGLGPQESAERQLALDQLAAIGEWEHYGILSLLETSSAKFESKWISRRLGITPIRAKLAMERLLRLGLVEHDARGRFKQSVAPLRYEKTVSVAGLRRFHRQMLEKAQESMENLPFDEREISGITFAADPALLPYARERIRKFRRELCSDLEKRGGAREVFHLGVQMFPLSGDLGQASSGVSSDALE